MAGRRLARRTVARIARTFRRRGAAGYRAAFVEHTLPGRLAAGEICGVRCALENTGTRPWRTGPRATRLGVFLDDTLISRADLPRPCIAPGERITFHFALHASGAPGPHRVRLDLELDGVGWFSEFGSSPALHALTIDLAPATLAARALEIALRHNLWHYLPTCGIGRSRQGRPFPLFISRARGSHVWDPDGRQYIDYTMGWGATILGYADDRIQRAIADRLDTAPLAPFPDPAEMEVSQMLVEDFPGAAMVLFGKNGSDVCTVAARLARLSTGRRHILSCGFHGWQDFCLEGLGFEASGIPEPRGRTFHRFRFNDRDAFFSLFSKYRRDLAAVMIEPAGPHGGEETGLEGDADPSFLHAIADAARRAGALVVFDEIITGYRYPGGSVQKASGVVPDLTCLGKALASGMPLAALLGHSRRFHELMARTHYCPTFKAEVYSLAAAKAAIPIYRSEPVAAHIWQHGTRLIDGIDRLCADAGLAASCKGPPFRFGPIFHERDPYRRRLKRTLYFQKLLEQGVITVTGVMLPAFSHTEEILQTTLRGIGRAVADVAEADRRNELERLVEIPLL